MKLRGPSADAVSRLEETLPGSASGAELFGVASLLRSEPALRRVLTDVSLPGEAKAGLVQQVLGGKVSAEVLGVVADAATRRWTATRDLPDALEHLGVVAVVKSDGAQTGRLSDELFSFGQIVNDNPELRDALSDPARSLADKRGLIQRLLAGKALPATVALAEQALAGTYRTVTVALDAYEQVAADVHGQGVATVRVAHPLSEADRQRLTDSLSRQYARPIHVNVVIDPAVLGGIKVEIGDDVIDGTVASRLDDARRKLAG
jgi:F-type H+-transporting ATPase subunit delta